MQTIAIVLLPVFLTALLTSILTRHFKDRDKFTEAAGVFKSAFNKAIIRLGTESGRYREILADEFPVHRNAMIIFREHLGKRKAGFDKAWKEYEAYYNEKAGPGTPVAFFIGLEVLDLEKANDPKHIQESNEFFKNQTLNHINPLLKFTKIKWFS